MDNLTYSRLCAGIKDGDIDDDMIDDALYDLLTGGSSQDLPIQRLLTLGALIYCAYSNKSQSVNSLIKVTRYGREDYMAAIESLPSRGFTGSTSAFISAAGSLSRSEFTRMMSALNCLITVSCCKTVIFGKHGLTANAENTKETVQDKAVDKDSSRPPKNMPVPDDIRQKVTKDTENSNKKDSEDLLEKGQDFSDGIKEDDLLEDTDDLDDLLSDDESDDLILDDPGDLDISDEDEPDGSDDDDSGNESATEGDTDEENEDDTEDMDDPGAFSSFDGDDILSGLF